MICFMFPGQPLNHDATLPDDADFAEIATLCLNRTGLDLLSFAWRDGTHSEQVALQVYGVAMSLYRHRRLFAGGVRPDVIAEHSMGIYPALAACGSITERVALEMAFRVGVCMEERFGGKEYALGCVVGLTEGPLAAVAADNGVYPANFNTSRHFLLAGPRAAIETACAETTVAGAFSAAVFPCDAPLHTPLMEEISSDLHGIFSDYRYAEPAIPLMEHIGQRYLSAAAIPAFLCEELCFPVFWDRTYRALKTAGVARFQEVGVGQALAKFNRWMDSEP
jgi:malonyl CoA-acyl carrier protein transacylase